jgi:hypothetical protein
LGLSLGVEKRLEGVGGVGWGPVASASIGHGLTSRLQVQGRLAAAWRGSGGESLGICAPLVFCGAGADPGSTQSLAAELVAYDRPGQKGAYVLAGLGALRYSSGAVESARLRVQADLGLGVSVPIVLDQLFVEWRLVRVLNGNPFPGWFTSFSAGYRLHL